MLKFVQSLFDFQAVPKRPVAEPAAVYPAAPEPEPPRPSVGETTEDAELTDRCRQLLAELDLKGASGLIRVVWNTRLRSTAGYASYPAWRIELNPRLHEFEGQVDRTLKHELAHLVAYHRVGRKRIEPHGAEWRQACADLGIPDETARHRLPLPRREVSRNYTYVCPNCAFTAKRVRKFRRFTACHECCSKFNGGLYDGRFRFVLVEDKRAAAAKAAAKR